MKRKTDLLAASDLRFSISLTSSRDYRSTRNLSDSWNGERYNVKKKKKKYCEIRTDCIIEER